MDRPAVRIAKVLALPMLPAAATPITRGGGGVAPVHGRSDAETMFGMVYAVAAGGDSGDPASRHCDEQAARDAAGVLRPACFGPDERAGPVARRDRPGG